MAKWLSRADIGDSVDAHRHPNSQSKLEDNRQTAPSNIEWWLARQPALRRSFLLSFPFSFSKLGYILTKRDGLGADRARTSMREDNPDASGPANQNYFFWPMVFNNIQLSFLVRRFPKGCQDISSPALNGGLRRSGEVSRSPNASHFQRLLAHGLVENPCGAGVLMLCCVYPNHGHMSFQFPNHGMAFLVQTLSGAFSCNACAT